MAAYKILIILQLSERERSNDPRPRILLKWIKGSQQVKKKKTRQNRLKHNSTSLKNSKAVYRKKQTGENRGQQWMVYLHQIQWPEAFR